MVGYLEVAIALASAALKAQAEQETRDLLHRSVNLGEAIYEALTHLRSILNDVFDEQTADECSDSMRQVHSIIAELDSYSPELKTKRLYDAWQMSERATFRLDDVKKIVFASAYTLSSSTHLAVLRIYANLGQIQYAVVQSSAARHVANGSGFISCIQSHYRSFITDAEVVRHPLSSKYVCRFGYRYRVHGDDFKYSHPYSECEWNRVWPIVNKEEALSALNRAIEHEYSLLIAPMQAELNQIGQTVGHWNELTQQRLA